MRPLVWGSRERSRPATAKRATAAAASLRAGDAGRGGVAGRHGHRLGGYSPRRVERLEEGHEPRPVAGVGEPAPRPTAPEDAHPRLPRVDEGLDGREQEVLGARAPRVLVQEAVEAGLERGQEGRGEAPEVQGDGCLAGDRLPGARLETPRVLAVPLDLQYLADRDEEALAVHGAHAAAHRRRPGSAS